VDTVTLSLNLNLIEPPTSSIVTPPAPPFVVPNTFQIAADNSGTGADGTFLMGQQEDEYYTGFGLEPYGDGVLTFSYDHGAKHLTTGLYILYATTGNTPPVIRTGVVGHDFDPPGYPLVCDFRDNGKLNCTANGNIYGTLMLVNGKLSLCFTLKCLGLTCLANNDGLLELAIGNAATPLSSFISIVDLFIIHLSESDDW
jgi:hypothetical protein